MSINNQGSNADLDSSSLSLNTTDLTWSTVTPVYRDNSSLSLNTTDANCGSVSF